MNVLVSNNEAGVMCLDFHPESTALLAVGLYDGTVLVYDIRNNKSITIQHLSEYFLNVEDMIFFLHRNIFLTLDNF